MSDKAASREGELVAVCERVVKSFDGAAASLTSAHGAVSRLAEVSERNAKEAQHASALSSDAGDRVRLATQALRKVVESGGALGELSTRLTQVLEVFEAIRRSSAQIQDIAAQSNILAINAAIQAAQHGAEGKGFAIIAQSMRELSRQSQDLAGSIEGVLEQGGREIDGVASGVKQQMDELGGLYEGSVEHLLAIETAVDEIGREMADVVDGATDVSETASTIASTLRARSEQLSRESADAVATVTGTRVEELHPEEALKRLERVVIVDVRSPAEFQGELGRLPRSTLLTLDDDFAKKVATLAPDRAYLFVCRRGARSLRAARIAIERGLRKVASLTGGMELWNEKRYPAERGAVPDAALVAPVAGASPLTFTFSG